MNKKAIANTITQELASLNDEDKLKAVIEIASDWIYECQEKLNAIHYDSTQNADDIGVGRVIGDKLMGEWIECNMPWNFIDFNKADRLKFPDLKEEMIEKFGDHSGDFYTKHREKINKGMIQRNNVVNKMRDDGLMDDEEIGAISKVRLEGNEEYVKMFNKYMDLKDKEHDYLISHPLYIKYHKDKEILIKEQEEKSFSKTVSKSGMLIEVKRKDGTIDKLVVGDITVDGVCGGCCVENIDNEDIVLRYKVLY